jgi:tetratricopeptide (TPR) repeat protein
MDALRHGTPNPAPVQRMLGQIYENNARMDDAELMFRRAAIADPADDETWRVFQAFAVSRNRSAALERAVRNGLAALKAQPEPSRETLAVLYGMLAELEGARDPGAARATAEAGLTASPARFDLWRRYIALTPSDRRWDALRNEFKRLGGGKDAKLPGVLAALVQVDTSDGAALAAIASNLADALDTRTATTPPNRLADEYGWIADLLQDAAKKLQGAAQGKLFAELAGVELRIGRIEDADALLLQAQALLPAEEQTAAWLHRSEVCAARRQFSEALSAAMKAVQLTPNDLKTRWNLARRFAAAGRAEDAQKEYTSLLSQVPKDHPAHAILQQEYAALGAAPASGGIQ